MPGDRTQTHARPGTAIGLAGCWVLLALIAREPALDSPGFATVWPAGGIAALWFLLRAARPLSVDTVLLAAGSAGVNAALGASAELNAVFTVTNVVQTLFAVWLLRQWCPGLWGSRGDRPLDRPRTLLPYGGALAIACEIGRAHV